ncbi:MAG: DUF2141 domain-containing protein [Flavobacteriales bacterium]|nr:DUF2141 domain-containing protein [Flavobacteriales bacterium]MCW8913024.1 DUF2141 domain-containing protein [Flavobacteriales bacterium]MCW8938367.1 DUF2141 domain-containing protein [Flavobacteriales bacterium]MCW8940296.1 DUF2141 domain-containing protein [Flavobacteriales bacterium]MCW8967676.1 DUF2141 domain-containing protein [Flavobacteriales bacterium]
MKPFILLAVAIFFLNFITPNANTINLTVEVHELRNNKGLVQFALYNKDGSIPDENFEKYYQIGKTTIKENAAQFVFKNIPKGIYAVNILHDENENGKIDKGLILPEEGIGFSNYTKIGLGNKPNFSKASIELNTDNKIAIKVIYF